MLRHSSPIQSVLVYATFFTISLMIHMVVVWPRPGLGPSATSAETAPVESAGSVSGDPRPDAEAGRSESKSERGGVFK